MMNVEVAASGHSTSFVIRTSMFDVLRFAFRTASKRPYGFAGSGSAAFSDLGASPASGLGAGLGGE